MTALETPRVDRPFASGWIAGTMGLAASIAGLALVLALKFPDIFFTPELQLVTFSPWFRFVILFLLVAAFALAALSMVLRRRKTLGVTTLAVALLATLLGGLRMPSGAAETNGLCLHPA